MIKCLEQPGCKSAIAIADKTGALVLQQEKHQVMLSPSMVKELLKFIAQVSQAELALPGETFKFEKK
jgi:hypothetical protein